MLLLYNVRFSIGGFPLVTSPFQVLVWFRYFLSDWHQNAFWGETILEETPWLAAGSRAQPWGLWWSVQSKPRKRPVQLPFWDSERNFFCFWEGEVGEEWEPKKRRKRAELKRKLRYGRMPGPVGKGGWPEDFLQRGLWKTQRTLFKFLQGNTLLGPHPTSAPTAYCTHRRVYKVYKPAWGQRCFAQSPWCWIETAGPEVWT